MSGTTRASGSCDERVKKLWKERGFTEPTLVQRLSFNPIFSGKNTLIIAPTGSGKTEAALIPILARMCREQPDPVALLYITPLRALNRDLLDRIRWWGEKLGFKVDVRHGDTSGYRRGKQAKEPPHILITTPETLQSILPAKKMGEHLKNVKYVIIDEIHEMYAEKRGYQLAIGLERLVERAGEFQRIGISATVGDTGVASRFLVGIREAPVVVDARHEKGYEITVHYPTPSKEDAEEARRLGLAPEVYARLKFLKSVIERHKQVITFVNTRNMAEQLSLYFSALHEGTDVHHSSLSRDVRLQVEKTFKSGEIRHLIATSSMELGIDVGEVDAVVQYGSPRQALRLLQRVGRAGHRWDRTSRGYVIALDPDDFTEAAVITKRALSGYVEAPQVEEKPYDVLAHQIAGILMDFGEIEIERAFSIVKRAFPYHSLQMHEFDAIIRQLESEMFLRRMGDRIRRSRDTWRYYYFHLSMIPDQQRFRVVDTVSGSPIATLDEDFVVEYLQPGISFVVKGRPWRVIAIEDERVLVEPSADLAGAIPAWIGEMIPVEREVAEDVARERRRIADRMETIENVAEVGDIEKIRAAFQDYPRPDEVRIETGDRFAVILVPLGSRGNAALSRLVAVEINRRYGIPVRTFSSPYAITIEFPSEGFRAEDVRKTLESLNPELVEILIENHVTKTRLFISRFLHVAQRFGLISRNAKLGKINVRRLIDAMADSPVYRETLKELFTEKLDINAVKQLLEELREGARRVTVSNSLSKYAKRELSRALQVPELVNAETPEKAILDMFKERIMDKRVTLVCTSCGATMERRVRELPDRPKCIRCGSALLAVVHDPKAAAELIRKKRLKKPEEKKMLELIRGAELVAEFGKKAITAMAVPGIGSTRAARILRTPYSEEEFWKALLDAEREYYRTRMFWEKRTGQK